MFGNIPHEMHFYRQWIVWRLEDQGGPKPTKVPYSPIVIGAKASVDKPGTWGTFNDAIAAHASGAFSGIGFVLTDDDPYVFIDLDDTKGDEEGFARQQRIFSEIPSYAERSPSGNGLHIIAKGKVDRGRKRSNIELYSNLRFMTMTGDVYRDAPIIECNDAIMLLWHQLGGPAAIHQYGGNAEQREDDGTVIGRALSALNGDKFKRLFEGDYATDYGDEGRSEGDQALVDIVAFYTQNREQIERIWMNCPLGQREKVQKRKDYRTWTINKAFDRMLPPTDLEGLKINWEDICGDAAQVSLPGFEGENGAAEGPTAPTLAAEPGRTEAGASLVAQAGESVNSSNIILPPGLLGEVANFIYEQAPRPVTEIALVGAIGFVSGIVGRAFNISATGLNMYALCLAPTGTGKEAINSGISKLITAAAQNVPAIRDFIGPGDTRSDAALIKWLAKAPCIFSVQGEWGMRLKQMSSPYANSNEIGVKKVIMDLFNKSGHGNILNPLAYSDRTNNTPAINAPSFSLIGESTPEKFYEALDESMIADGLLPRFLTIEYHGKRPPMSDRAAFATPSFALTDMVQVITTHCLEIMARNSVVNVAVDPYADKLLRDFNSYCDAHINDDNANEVVRHMWNRGHVKALKLAALVAVGVYPYNPVIDLDAARWACDLVAKDIVNVVDRFTRGEVGASVMGVSERKQIDDMVKVIRTFMNDGQEAAKYGTPGNIHAAGVILGASLSRRLMAMASFRTDRLGATNAIKRTLQHLLDADDLRELPRKQMQDTFGTGGRGFAVSNPHSFRK